MRKHNLNLSLIILLLTFTFMSCSQANVFEYTVVFEDKLDGHMDTIVGNTISFDNSSLSKPECELCTDGLRWMIRNNWGQGTTRGHITCLDAYWNSVPVSFNTKIVDRCKIGFFETKMYPKHKRQKYSDILYN